MSNRREFLRNLTLGAGAAALLPTATFSEETADLMNRISASPPDGADEDFWRWVQQSYTESPSIINLNNGGVSPQPKVVQEAFEQYNRMCNEAPSYYMWRILDKGRESLRTNLAELSGVSADEIAINRNTTEALDIIIFGLRLEEGDEVIGSNFDYPNVYNAYFQREKRDGIKYVQVDLDAPMEDDDEIVKRFTDAFSNKTKVVHITHIINWTGQILPARKIADAAHADGIEVVVDGAHSFAHLNYQIPDLGCDYYGTSLHKWLCAPFGTGMLYVKQDKIPNLWPTMPGDDPESEDIRKYEALGTRSFPAEHAVAHAIDFHNVIGAQRKQERLHFLKDYWIDQVADLDRFQLHTSRIPEYSCALSVFGMDGLTGNEVERTLLSDHQIHTTTINKNGISGVRVTPHVYTKLSDLDRLATAIDEMNKA